MVLTLTTILDGAEGPTFLRLIISEGLWPHSTTKNLAYIDEVT